MSEKIGRNGKPFNPSLGRAHTHPKFATNGKDTIKWDITPDILDGNGKVLEEGTFTAIMKNLQIGGSILLKFNTVTKINTKQYYVEYLPPKPGYEYKGNTTSKASTQAPVSEID